MKKNNFSSIQDIIKTVKKNGQKYSLESSTSMRLSEGLPTKI